MTSITEILNRHLQRITRTGRYIPEIDGLRFIAIASVVLFHIGYAVTHRPGNLDFPPSLPFDIFSHGHRGVELFFAISGFILALPFAQCCLSSGRPVGLRSYYVRRLTRIEPPYVVALVVFYLAAVLMNTSDVSDSGFARSFWLRLFYLNGLWTGQPPTLNGVTWSLEVEVQF